MNEKTRKIREYIKDALVYLDGQGLIVTDWDLIDESLKNFENFDVLKHIVTKVEITSGEWIIEHSEQLRNLQKKSGMAATMEFAELQEEYQDLFDSNLIEDLSVDRNLTNKGE